MKSKDDERDEICISCMIKLYKENNSSLYSAETVSRNLTICVYFSSEL